MSTPILAVELRGPVTTGVPVAGPDLLIDSTKILSVFVATYLDGSPFALASPYPRLAFYRMGRQVFSQVFSPTTSGWELEDATNGRIGYRINGQAGEFNALPAARTVDLTWQLLSTLGGTAEVCLAKGRAVFSRIEIQPTDEPTDWVARTDLVVTLTDAPVIVTDASLGDVFEVTLLGSRTLGVPLKPLSGQRCLWRFRQGSAGGPFLLTFNPIFRFTTDVPPLVLSIAPGAVDYMGAIYRRSENLWDVLATSRGY